MKVETLPVIKGENNLLNYEETYANFNWEEVNKNFSWYETGRVNMAYEAIDKHAKSDRKIKWRFIIKMVRVKKNIHLKK